MSAFGVLTALSVRTLFYVVFIIVLSSSRLFLSMHPWGGEGGGGGWGAAVLRDVGIYWLSFKFEPAHDKTYKMACAPSEDSDQPGHPPSLIRIFAVRVKKDLVLSYPLSAQRRLIRLGGCPG